MRAPGRPRFGGVRAATIWAVTIAACLTLTSANAAPMRSPPASPIAGLDALGTPPDGPSWAPAPITTAGLRSVATAAHGQYALHTAGGEVTFLPGVNLGELSGEAAKYRSWFPAMSRLGLRAIRIATIHPPAFYQELAAYNRARPDRPLYLMQGIHLATGRGQIRNAVGAVSGDLTSRAGRTWNADITPWLLGWIIDPGTAGPAPAVNGRYFASAATATPAERWVAARMDELAGYEAGRGLSQPISSLRVDPGHIRATAAWPAGTFASDRYRAGLSKHGNVPTMVTEFGVASSVKRSEQQAMAVDAQLLGLIHERGLAGGFLQAWTDRLGAAQGYGLVAADATGAPNAPVEYLIDDENAWPARRITAHVDESYVWLRIALGRSPPNALTLSFDVLPNLTGRPPPGSDDRWGDAAFALDLVAHTGRAYIRQLLDPSRPASWRLAGSLYYGPWAADSRSLWQTVDGDLVVRVPWAMLGYSDPSRHEIGLGRRGTRISPGVGLTVSAAGTDQQTGEVTWVNWNHTYSAERLKTGAAAFRDVAVTLAP